MNSKKTITGIVLAGGKSRRMSTDKALLLFKGKPFLSHVIEALKPLVDEILIVSNKKEHGEFNFKRVSDTMIDAGPLSGLHAGLNHSNTELNIVLSCDVPLIQTSVLEIILANITDENDVIQIEEEGKTHPLIALYKKRATPHLLAALEKGERKLSKALMGLNVKNLPISRSHYNALRNINNKSDLKSIENEY